MTTTTSPRVGDSITDRQVYHDLPVGSVVQGDYTWTKVEENRWTSTQRGRVHHDDTLSTSGSIRITSIPGIQSTETRPDWMVVGHRLNAYNQAQQLPVGTKVAWQGYDPEATRPTHWAEKINETRWVNTDSRGTRSRPRSNSGLGEGDFSIDRDGHPRGWTITYLPDPPLSLPAWMEIGTPLTTDAMVEECPVGTELTWSTLSNMEATSRTRARKTADREWWNLDEAGSPRERRNQHENSGSFNVSMGSGDTTTAWRVSAIPTTVTKSGTYVAPEHWNFLNVGDQITCQREVTDLPVGSTIEQTAATQHWYTKRERNQWGEGDRAAQYNDATFGGGSYRVRSLPEGHVPLAPLKEEGPETVDRFLRKYREMALNHARRAGVSLPAVNRFLESMKVPEFDPVEGMEVRGEYLEYDEELPIGTIVACGSPDHPDRFGVWHKVGTGDWVQVLGKMRDRTGFLRVEHLPPGERDTSWFERQPGEGEAKVLARVKADLWKKGWMLKRDQSWCGEYENAVARVGLTEAVLQSTEAALSKEEQAQLPAGTILRRVSNDEVATYYIRDDAMGNSARTRLLFGQRTTNTTGSAAVAKTPDQTWQEAAVFPVSQGELDCAPPGTEIANISNWAERYTKQTDGRWQRVGGSTVHPASVFDITTANISWCYSEMVIA